MKTNKSYLNILKHAALEVGIHVSSDQVNRVLLEQSGEKIRSQRERLVLFEHSVARK